MSDAPRPKMKKQRMTGLFAKTNDYGTYYVGKLDDGTHVIVHEPHPDAVVTDSSPTLILSKLVPDTGPAEGGA